MLRRLSLREETHHSGCDLPCLLAFAPLPSGQCAWIRAHALRRLLKAYTRPWTAELHPELIPDTDLLEFVCENKPDLPHLVGECVSNETPERISESLLDSAIRPDNDGNQAAVAPRFVQSRLAELHPPLFITGALGVPLAK